VQPEFLLPLIFLQEVLMSSKLVSLSTMNFHKRRKTTFIELVELVVSVERVLPSTLSYQMMPSSLEKSRIITILKLKKCHKILRSLPSERHTPHTTYNLNKYFARRVSKNKSESDMRLKSACTCMKNLEVRRTG
jgi:hypothetical protein